MSKFESITPDCPGCYGSNAKVTAYSRRLTSQAAVLSSLPWIALLAMAAAGITHPGVIWPLVGFMLSFIWAFTWSGDHWPSFDRPLEEAAYDGLIARAAMSPELAAHLRRVKGNRTLLMGDYMFARDFRWSNTDRQWVAIDHAAEDAAEARHRLADCVNRLDETIRPSAADTLPNQPSGA